MKSKWRITVIFSIFVMAMLAACNSGGGSTAPGLPVATITAQPTDQTVVSGTTATFTVAASNATGYQWQISTNSGSSFSDISSATAASYSTGVTALSDSGTQYRVIVSGAGNSVTSSAVTLSVTSAANGPAITVQPISKRVTAPASASFSVTATGTSLAYQWQRCMDALIPCVSWGDIPGETLATYSTGTSDTEMDGDRYRVVVTNNVSSVQSVAVTLTVDPTPTMPAITTQPLDATVDVPTAANFFIAFTGIPTPVAEWQYSNNNTDWFSTGISGTGLTIDPTSLGDNNRKYRAVVSNATGTVTSTVVTLYVNVAAIAPAFTTQPVNVTITEGQNAQFTVAVTGTPTPNLQWQVSTDSGAHWGNINGETGTTFNILNPALANSGRQFRVVATNSAGTVNSDAVTLTVNPVSPLLKIVYVQGYGIESGKNDLYLVKEDGSGRVVLAETADNEIFSAIAPGERIVYQRVVGGQLDLYSVNSGGTDLRSLATTTYDEIFSAITASGRVIYRRDGVGTGRDLWSVGADGTNTQVLASSAKHEDFVALTASGKVIYNVAQWDGTSDLYIVNADGTGTTALSTDASYYKAFKCERPDGQLVFEINNGYGSGGFYMIAQTGGSAAPLAVNSVPDEYSYGGITSTGHVIINRRVDGQRDLYGANGGGLVSLATSTDYEQYAGSTSAGKVIFSREAARNAYGATQFDLYIVNTDGSNLVSLASTTTNDEMFGGVASDGRIIYGSCGNIDGLCDLYSVQADGTGTVVLANSASYQEFYQGITPSGRVIYSKENGFSSSLYAVNTDGTGTSLLPGGGYFVATTTDNKVLIRNQDNGNSNLYIVNADGTGSTALANTGNNENFIAILP